MMSVQPNAPAKRGLPALPGGRAYGIELEEVLRIAAWIGQESGDDAPISFTSVLIAFLIHERPVSQWFQNFCRRHSVDTRGMFGEKGFNPDRTKEILARVHAYDLPDRPTLMSQSFRRVLTNAADIAGQVGRKDGRFGGRFVMAAYACFDYEAHIDQVVGWKIDRESWKRDFLDYAIKQYPNEGWSDFASRLMGSPLEKGAPQKIVPAAVPTELIGDFLSDNPYSTDVADLLKVEDEASAFARLIAARDIDPPLAIGIFGEWGSGKTFFMHKMSEQIRKLAAKRKGLDSAAAETWPYLEDIVEIHFDAWHYAEQNLWASLVDYIFAKLDAWMLDRSRDDPSGVDHVLDRLATTQQLKLDALETLILRRSERQAAEARAERTRAEYQQALKRREAIRPTSYLLAAIKRLASGAPQNGDVKQILATRDEAVKALGIPELQRSSERLEAAVMEARTEAGRARLVTHSLLAKMGTVGGVAAILTVLVILPALAVGLRDLLAEKPVLAWLANIKGTLVAASTTVAGIAASLSGFVRRARRGLNKLDEFDRKLQEEIEAKRDVFESSAVASQDRLAQEDLQKSRQAFEAAEKALAVADANLLAARQDFESGTARGRLNAFIRSKVTSGEYAKHLGIVATIRRDFSQLAALMNTSNNEAQEKAERERLGREAAARVDRFIGWLKITKDVKLTIRELTELFNFLEPVDALVKLRANKALLAELLQGQATELDEFEKELEASSKVQRKLPRFSRIVLYIDDLDRCEAKKVVDVLQAVHLLLSFPLFVVVVAVDARWVSRALKDHYPGLLADESDAGSGARPYDYLEKIFQIPYWVRPMDKSAAQTFVEGIASSARKKRSRDEAVDIIEGNAAPAAGRVTIPVASANAETVARSTLAEGDAPAKSVTPVDEEHPEPTERLVHAGVSLNPFEVKMLRRFAPFVGDTPRRALRFVNIYRLVKTCLPADLRDTFVGENGESALYRSLIAQLAVANGLPRTASYFFREIANLPADASGIDLRSHDLDSTREFVAPQFLPQLLALVDSLNSSGEGIAAAKSLTAKDLQSMTTLARRYSFERY